jgi:hypothetical protein
MLPTKPSVGDTSNVDPLHTTVLNTPISALGLTETTTVNGRPVQFPVNGLTLYVTVSCVFHLFVNVPDIDTALPAAAKPVNEPVYAGKLQL